MLSQMVQKYQGGVQKGKPQGGVNFSERGVGEKISILIAEFFHLIRAGFFSQ